MTEEAEKFCHNCDNERLVLGAHGERRPCSRCRPEDFSIWYAEKVVEDIQRRRTERDLTRARARD